MLNKHQQTSLVVQWLKIHLPMQETWVQSLVQEDSTCHTAAKPTHHSYRACALELVFYNKRSRSNEKPAHH